ncbi:slipin family protein [Methylotenera sp.]|uniref:slipin family protein n=1 Tax=Methylotenera sp. TaxID=2051956 RepID=UPI00248A76DE|nr:slipin family protein [Methylotenera sp.]MDI1298164.1 slipin family protein [Methylotenera sp.]
MFRKKVVIEENQRGLLFKEQQFERVLDKGVYHFWDFRKQYTVKIVSANGAAREIVAEDLLMLAEANSSKFTPYLDTWETEVEEIGLVYEANKLMDIKLPNQRGAFWKGVRATHVKKVNISTSFKIDERTAALMLGAESEKLRKAAGNAIYTVTVPEGYVSFLDVNGQVTETLHTGTYAWWKFSRVLKTKLYDMRLQNMEINGQEILTKDKVSLRINLSATWQIADAEKVRLNLADHTDFLYREMQLALRTVVSTQTLDQLLQDKNLLNLQVQQIVAGKALEYGITVKSVGARDIVLPGEMKTILAQVVEAEKLAEANVIRRREETQATRSLHNTAKVMEGNPILLRLKELESLEKITGQIKSLNVYGGLQGVMNDMVKLTDRTKIN